MLGDEDRRSAGPEAAPDDELGGRDLSRVLALSDGIFAFAMTLLALSLSVPVFRNAQGVPLDPKTIGSGQLAGALAADAPSFLTYLLGFFLIAYWWEIHRRLFTHIQRWDRRVLWLNLLFLVNIAVTPFLVSLYTTYGDDQVALLLYAGAQGLGGILLALLWHHATRGRRLVAPSLTGEQVARYRTRLLVSSGIFGVSMAVSFVSVPVAQLLWVSVFAYSAWMTRSLHAARRRSRGAPPVSPT